MKEKRVLVPLTALVLAALTCSLPFGSPAGRGGRGQITDEQRASVLADLAEFHASLPGEKGEQDREALVKHLDTRSEFEAAGLAEDGSVWGRFRDGRLVIFFPDNLPPAGAPESGSPSPAGAPASTRPPPSRDVSVERELSGPSRALNAAFHPSLDPPSLAQDSRGELPESSVVFVLSALDPSKHAPEEHSIAEWLRSKKYSATTFEPSVDALKAVRGAGVLYFETHGGMGTIGRPGDEDGGFDIMYALWTTTPQSKDNDRKYADDLASRKLVYGFSNDDTVFHYSITSSFVRSYMSFSEDSFVYIGGCGGFNSDMRSSFGGAGAAVYAGWTTVVNSTCAASTASALFDMLLGTNDYLLLEPPQRPFDYGRIWAYLREQGQDKCANRQGGVSQLMFEALGDNFAILVPTIRTMEVDEVEETLTLYGLFGSDEGKVTIGDGSVSVKNWQSEEIVVELPPIDQPNGAGDVVVSVRDHESNAAPLTRWKGQFRYIVTLRYVGMNGNPEQKGTFDLQFRADVHPYREKPGGSLTYPEVWVRTARDSSGQWTHSGSASNPDVAVTHSGSGSFNWYDPRQSPAEQNPYFTFYGTIYTDEKRIEATLSALEPRGTKTWRTSKSSTQGEGNWLLLDVLTDDLKLEGDDGFNFSGDQRTGITIHGIDMSMNVANGILEWDSLKAEFAPDENTYADLPGRRGTSLSRAGPQLG